MQNLGGKQSVLWAIGKQSIERAEEKKKKENKFKGLKAGTLTKYEQTDPKSGCDVIRARLMNILAHKIQNYRDPLIFKHGFFAFNKGLFNFSFYTRMSPQLPEKRRELLVDRIFNVQ